MIDKLFESVHNLFEEDEEKVSYERSDVEISPVVYSVELYINDKPQEDYYEKFEDKDTAIEYGKKLLNMIGKDEEFTVQVLSYNTENGKLKVEWRETNQKWGEGFFELDENNEMKSILESTGYYDELSDIHNTDLAGNYDETLEKVSKEDYKELKDEKAVQVEGLNESISEEAQEKLWKNGFLFDIDQYDLGPENERDYVKSYTDRKNNISWRPYLGNEEKDMFYIKGDHSGKLYSLDEIIDIKNGTRKLESITESDDEESVSYQIDIMSCDEDGRTEEIIDEKKFENKDAAINYAKEQLKQLKLEYKDVFADLYRVTPILNYDTKEYEERLETIAQIMSNGYVELLESDESNKMTIMDFCDKMELTKDHGSLIMDKLDCDDWDSTKFTIQELYKAMDDCKDTDRDNWDELFESMDYNYVKMDYLDNHDREIAIKKLIEIGEATNREDAEIEIDDWDEEDELWSNDEENLNEDTEKQNGKWVNKGKEGTHGTFKTKKEADAQRKAMFANGYLKEEDENVSDFDIEDTTFLQNSPTIEDESIRERTIQMRNEIANSLLPPEEIEALSDIAFSLNNGTFADPLFFDNPQTPGLQDLGKRIKHKYGEELKNNQENLLNEFRLQDSLRREYYDLLDKYRKAKNAGKNLNTPAMKKNIERLKEIKKSFIESKDKSDVYHENISNIYIPEVKKYIEGYVMKFIK